MALRGHSFQSVRSWAHFSIWNRLVTRGADNPPLMVHQIGADLEFHFSGFTNVNHPSPVSGGLQCQQATCGITGTIERNIRATVGEFGDNLRQTFGGC